jgi:hypothetical protein
MMSREDGICQVIELPGAMTALIALPLRLLLVLAALLELRRAAVGTGNAVGPAHLAYHLEAFGVINQVVDPKHSSSMPPPWRYRKSTKR